MTDETWEVIDEVSGQFQAELIRGMLEAQEIPVVLSQEGIGRVYAFTVGSLATVQVLVPVREAERARQVLEEYYSRATEDSAPPEEPELGEDTNP